MNFINEIKKEFHPRLLLPSLTVGLLVSIMSIGTIVSLAAFIFSGSLSPFLAGGIGLVLFGALVMGIVVAFTTSLPAMIAIPQDTPAAILALVASGIALAMRSAQPQSVYVTVVAAIALTSLLMAVILLLLGRFHASGFVRYIPYPVVGGFLAGTGWLLAKGAFGVMLGLPMTLANLPQAFTVAKIVDWLPGLIFAVVLLLVLRRYHHFLITPAALLLATALFYGYLFLAHISVAQASAAGWLLGPFPGGSFYQPLAPASLSQVDWMAILGQADKIVTILVLSVVALLLNTSALEGHLPPRHRLEPRADHGRPGQFGRRTGREPHRVSDAQHVVACLSSRGAVPPRQPGLGPGVRRGTVLRRLAVLLRSQAGARGHAAVPGPHLPA